jgi:pimeloyl-ACP methyl ester carboxylesterase
MMLPVEDHHLRVVDLGRGTPLLLHDGWVASWDLWLPLIERLQDGFRCIAYDHRGAGASTFPPSSISSEALVDDVFRVLDAAGIDRCVVAGESLGCQVVEQAVIRDPSRFLGLVLVGGPVTSEPEPGSDAGMAEQAARIRGDWERYLDRFVSACLPEPDAAPLHRWGVQTLLPAGPEAGVAMFAVHHDLVVPLEEISVPTLVIHGALDVIVPPSMGREAASRIPSSELVILDDAGHVPIITRPDAVAAAITDWWSRVGVALDG